MPTRQSTFRRFVTLVALVALVAVSALPLAARAQSTVAPADTLPFHAGQWGAQFVAGSQFAGVGLLRFHSGRAAWTANVDVNVSRGRNEIDQLSGTSSHGFAIVRLGHRWYRPVGRAVAAYAGTGISGGGGVTHSNGAFGRDRSASASAGAFGELGGAYFLTPHLSLGAGAALDVTAIHQSDHTVDSGGQPRHQSISGVSASLGSSSLFLSLYF